MYDKKYQNNEIKAGILENSMKTKCFGKKIAFFEEVDSTNAMAKQLGKSEGTHGMLVIAQQQNAGRGRLGRNWNSPKGSGVWMTIILKPHIHTEHASMLTLVAALAVTKGIKQVTGLDCFIKWPNDIVINGKKLCGILTEMNTMNGELEHVVVGIGINTNREYFSDDLKGLATSLQLELGHTIDRDELIVEIMKHMEYYYEIFMKTETLKELKQEYNQVLVNRDKLVRVLELNFEYNGIALGINETGALLVRTRDTDDETTQDIVKTIVAGEVSVRGIYGYV